MLMFYLDENKAPSQEQREQCYKDSAAFAQKLHEQGKFVATAPLQPTSSSTSLRHQDGKRIVTDGPFAETREQLAGFLIVQADHLDEAIQIAREVPSGRWGTVEIRPLIEVAGLPAENLAVPVDSGAAHSSTR